MPSKQRSAITVLLVLNTALAQDAAKTTDANKSTLELFLGMGAGAASIVQTLLVLLAVGVMAWVWRKRFGLLIDALMTNISRGSSVEFGPVKIGEVPTGVKAEPLKVDTKTDVGKKAAKEEQTKPEISDLVVKSVTELSVNNEAQPTSSEKGLYLVHSVEALRPRTRNSTGSFKVGVKLEADDTPQGSNSFMTIKSVTYTLHPDFRPSTVTVTDSSNGFALELKTYGEFYIEATVDFKDGKTLTLGRYLDLSGRPKD